jgi:hypothetical protein
VNPTWVDETSSTLTYRDTMERVGIIERAFQLASGSESLKEVRQRLTREGYVSVEAHLSGAQIRRELKVRLNSEESKVRDC